MLRHKADWQTLVYAAAATGLAVWQWHAPGFSPLLFAASLVLAFAVSVMHHNHQHLPMWRSAALNHATDFWFTVFQGHPGFAFEPSHLLGHHVHRNSVADITRTWRRHDGNGLLGFIAHPVLFVLAVAPALLGHLRGLWREDPKRLALIGLHYAWLAGVMAALLCLDWARAVLFVLIPQLAALFFCWAPTTCSTRTRTIFRAGTIRATSWAWSTRCSSTSAITRRTTNAVACTGASCRACTQPSPKTSRQSWSSAALLRIACAFLCLVSLSRVFDLAPPGAGFQHEQ